MNSDSRKRAEQVLRNLQAGRRITALPERHRRDADAFADGVEWALENARAFIFTNATVRHSLTYKESAEALVNVLQPELFEEMRISLMPAPDERPDKYGT